MERIRAVIPFSCIIVVIVIILQCFSVIATTSDKFYDLSNQPGYMWDRVYPQSCECAESGVSLSSCDLFKCKCICDVTAGKCDFNCCCDPDCTSDQVS